MKARRRDVLVATDGAVKGVQLPDMRHVIGYDLPKDVDSHGARSDSDGRAHLCPQCSACVARARNVPVY